MVQEKETSIQVICRAFNLLDKLSACGDNMSLAEISALTGCSKSTTFRILKTLKDLGYVAQNPAGSYYMTLKICTLSRRVLDKTDIINIARPYLKRLCSSVDSTVHIAVREGNEVVYVDRYENPSAPFRMASIVGKRRLLHTAAIGKSILAAMSDSEILEYWHSVSKPKLTPYTLVRLDDLLREMEEVRKTGYAVDNQENTLGVCCIAAAICNYREKPSYSISISGPLDTLTDEKLHSFSPFLLATKSSITDALGYI